MRGGFLPAAGRSGAGAGVLRDDHPGGGDRGGGGRRGAGAAASPAGCTRACI